MGTEAAAGRARWPTMNLVPFSVEAMADQAETVRPPLVPTTVDTTSALDDDAKLRILIGRVMT